MFLVSYTDFFTHSVDALCPGLWVGQVPHGALGEHVTLVAATHPPFHSSVR